MKYEKLYKQANGDYFKKLRGMRACKVFDPFWLAEQTEMGLDDTFFGAMKGEVARVRAFSRNSFDWESISTSKSYGDRVNARRIRERKRKIYAADCDAAEVGDAIEYIAADDVDVDSTSTDQGREASFDSWKEDPGERARRISIWWATHSGVERDLLKCFWNAFRLVILNQASSAGVERVFSQLNFIVREIGVHALEERDLKH
jgi:hypothetical protein